MFGVSQPVAFPTDNLLLGSFALKTAPPVAFTAPISVYIKVPVPDALDIFTRVAEVEPNKMRLDAVPVIESEEETVTVFPASIVIADAPLITKSVNVQLADTLNVPPRTKPVVIVYVPAVVNVILFMVIPLISNVQAPLKSRVEPVVVTVPVV